MNNRLLLALTIGLLQACSSTPQRNLQTTAATKQPISAKQAFLASGIDNTTETGGGEKGLMVVKQMPAEAKRKKSSASGAVEHYQGLSYWIERSNGNGFQRVTGASEFHNGDRIRFFVRSNRSGYLYIVTRGVSGRTAYLYPTKTTESEYIEAGKDYRIPQQDAIVFDNQPGTEEVWLFLSDTPLSTNRDETGAAPTTLASNQCGSKDLMLSSPDSAVNQCGPTLVGGNAKDIMIEDDSQSEQPGGYGVMTGENFDKGAMLSLKLQLRHK